ncbi:trehalose-6-phosphate synthase domain protein [Ancylostoma ceylanicum]|uniref:Trehalose-6-phosphate synthase domain protein n=1 Tax=Ancylostoma ceylanicum TaxID=53326 RepID=A0A0D6M610_9BILA|nr:trehalose-6-phosphate synthase domain protein [Ancylostoma ceylanicum]
MVKEVESGKPMGVETEVRSSSPVPERPFQRPLRGGDSDALERVKESCARILSRINVKVPASGDEDFLTYATNACCAEWKLRQQNSEIALKVAFWKIAVPLVYDSDLSFGTKFRDSLLFSLALYDVNNSKNRLRELYAAVPGVRQSMLGVHAKRFGEKYRHIQMVRSRANSRMSSRHGSMEDLLALDNDAIDDGGSDGASEGLSTGTGVGGLTNTSHHKQRVINVSNAPPVSIQRKGRSGGLVSCVDPVMSVDKENIWLSNLGINIKEERDDLDIHPPSTNSLGLPLIKQARAGEIFHVLEENDKKQELTDKEQLVERDMSLLSVLHDYNKTNYQLNPVFVSQEDYNAYYGGISNGLLWPALHNLAEYIVKEYDDPATLREHWCAYVRVNYQFGINAARNSRPQDFIWIHDYHLMLTGQIMRSLDSNLEVGFFLHIPFQPPANFMTKYKLVADPILRGILRFTKVGFQTHRDRERYVQMVREYIPRARVHYDTRIDIFTITYEGWTCSLGVFPVSIKNEDFLSIANEPQCAIEAQEIKQERKKFLRYSNMQVLAHSGEGGCFFFSVERFDYTKGIMEKLRAWKRFFEKHPERKGLDVLYQVAVTNRRAVESYKKYQDSCLALAKEINDTIKCDTNPEWKPLRFETDGLPRTRLVAHYLAMDIGVVTPSKDGMNLVAKEMMVCNPAASLVLSSGAGTENFAEVFYRAATEERAVRQEHGGRLNQFLKSHDIDEWSTAFLDPSWTHEVIRPCEIKQIADFYMLMAQTAQIRRQIVEVVLKGMPIRPHFALSLENAKNSLENSCISDSNRLVLETTCHQEDADGANTHATFDITDELTELQKDLAFLSFIQSDETNNVEQFIDTLGSFHPSGPTAFAAEVEKASTLLSQGDHFHYVFTDRDGTLKSYSCSYPTSVQPAYSAVIQAQFARRCAQFCAIVTTAPLVHIGILNMSTMPEGYYAYGASAGREWYFNPAMQFKDDSVSDADLMLLNKAFDKVEDLLENPEFRNFTWIGSGLQKHYGHITIAKQDVNNSIPHRKSLLLFDEVSKIVNEVDPSGAILTIRENEYDIKIYTKAKLSGRIFNKGHGVRLIERKMGMQLHDGNILVCGDSETDLPMLEECLSVAPPNVYTIWVTKDEALQEKVTQTCARFHNNNVTFVSCPEVLLGAMAQATVRELEIRGGDLDDDSDI